jgi:hypothetical protein
MHPHEYTPFPEPPPRKTTKEDTPPKKKRDESEHEVMKEYIEYLKQEK